MGEAKQGDIVYRGIYIRVTQSGEDKFSGEDLFRASTNKRIEVWGRSLTEQFVSATQWVKEEKVTRTEIARLLVGAGQFPFLVGFTKADDVYRELVGILVSHEDLMGRSMVRDLNISRGNPLRMVDHRTIRYLVLDGVRYDVKD